MYVAQPWYMLALVHLKLQESETAHQFLYWLHHNYAFLQYHCIPLVELMKYMKQLELRM